MTTAKGGRPRALTIEDIRLQQLLKTQNNKEEVNDSLATNNLKRLKELWALRRRGLTPNIASPPGGG